MSINIGAQVNDLPAPVITGTTIQSFTDVYGEVWVAKNGVYGGQWRKARDVLHAVIYRGSTWTAGTAAPGVVIPYDTPLRDIYGMFVASGFTVPIKGWYWVQATSNDNSTAAGTYVQGEIYQNAAQVTSLNHSTPISGGLSWSSYIDLYCNAGDAITCRSYKNGAANAPQFGQSNTRLEISYLGTG